MTPSPSPSRQAEPLRRKSAGEDRSRPQESDLLGTGAFPLSLLSYKSFLPVSTLTLCLPASELCSILTPKWSFQNPYLVIARHTSSTTTATTAAILQCPAPPRPARCSEKNRTWVHRLPVVWPCCPPQPHHIIPADRADFPITLNLHVPSCGEACASAGLLSWNSLPPLFPISVPAHPSKNKKRVIGICPQRQGV